MDLDEERVANLSQDVSFHHYAFGLILLLDVFLFHRFQGINLPSLFLTHQHHLSERPLSYHR